MGIERGYWNSVMVAVQKQLDAAGSGGFVREYQAEGGSAEVSISFPGGQRAGVRVRVTEVGRLDEIKRTVRNADYVAGNVRELGAAFAQLISDVEFLLRELEAARSRPAESPAVRERTGVMRREDLRALPDGTLIDVWMPTGEPYRREQVTVESIPVLLKTLHGRWFTAVRRLPRTCVCRCCPEDCTCACHDGPAGSGTAVDLDRVCHAAPQWMRTGGKARLRRDMAELLRRAGYVVEGEP
jgi:hypothetical protein